MNLFNDSGTYEKIVKDPPNNFQTKLNDLKMKKCLQKHNILVAHKPSSNSRTLFNELNLDFQRDNKINTICKI